jgi:hypothetical protein
MDYSDDRCLTLFTTGQKARMQAVLANCIRRNSLTTSTVCNAVSVKENAFSLNFRVYPNPTDGDFFVDVNLVNNEDFVISIFNTLGQTVKEVKRIQSNGGEIKIDLPDKNKGVYFVSIKTKSASIVKRIVIQ